MKRLSDFAASSGPVTAPLKQDCENGPADMPALRVPRSKTILLVDDDRAVREGLHRVLATEGWTIISAANGTEALEWLDDHQPDLLITDLMMGCISGWDLLFHEKLQRPNLPVFVITALPPSKRGGADHFATEFFPKPLDLESLVRAIRRCFDAVNSTPSRFGDNTSPEQVW